MKVLTYQTPKLHSPYLVTGLPGIGHVAKLSIDYLTTQLKAERFEEFYSPAFPPYVVITHNGTVELLKNELYFWQNKESDHDLVFFTGNVQAVTPEGQFELVNLVLERAKTLGVQSIFSIAAYVTKNEVNTPRVFGAVTKPQFLDQLTPHGVLPMENGTISGMNGLLFGHATLQGFQSFCLLGETPAYAMPSGQVFVDAKAAKAVLEVLTKVLDVDVDMEPLNNQAKMAEEVLHRINEMQRDAITEMQKSREREVPRYYV
jgi:uncharacterized protein (TIGR00162 family)